MAEGRGREAPRLVAVGDALPVEGVDHPGGVARHDHVAAGARSDREPHGELAAGRGAEAGLGRQAPRRRCVGDEGVHQVGGVDALPPLLGREQADADVDPAVAHREDPAVAGHDVALGVADVEVRLNEGVVVAVRPVVAAQGHAEGQLALARRAEHAADPGVRTVGHHHEARLDGAGAAGPLRFDRDPGQGGQRGRRGALVLDEGRDLGPLLQGGAGLGGACGHQPVEVVAGDRVPVVGEVGVLGPLHLDRLAEAEGAQPAVAVRVAQRILESHVGQLAYGAGRQPVAARLLAGELLLLHHDHVPPGVGQPVAARGAGRSGPDHHDVVHRFGRSAPGPLGGRPGRRGLVRRAGGGLLVGWRHDRIVGPRPAPSRRLVDVLPAGAAW